MTEGGAAAVLNAHYTGTCALLGVAFPLRFFNRLGVTEVDPDTICNKAGYEALGYLYGADDDGFVIAPTVFESVRDDAFLSCEEVFGPVASLYRFSPLDEAMERANASEFGLSAAIFTSSLATATRFQNEAQAGLLHVNSQTAGADVHVPFGGIKSSGFGPHEQGRAAIEFYTETVTVYVDP